MPDPTALDRALTEACAFATAHGVDSTITPRDFGIQRSDAGTSHATYVDGNHAVSVIVDQHGTGRAAVAELFWTHDQADEDRDPCDYCEANEPPPPSVTVVHLPGDAPEEVGADV